MKNQNEQQTFEQSQEQEIFYTEDFSMEDVEFSNIISPLPPYGTYPNMTCEALVELMDSSVLSFTNKHQRQLTWKQEEKSQLVNSLFDNTPIASLIANCTNGIYDILDGNNRVNCIYGLLKDKFQVKNVPIYKLNGIKYDINNLYFSQFPEAIQSIIKNRIVSFCYYNDLSDEQCRVIILRIANGRPFSAAHKTRLNMRSINVVLSFKKHEVWKNVLSKDGQRKNLNEVYTIKTWIATFHPEVTFRSVKMKEFGKHNEITSEQATLMKTGFTWVNNAFISLKATNIDYFKQSATKIKQQNTFVMLCAVIQHCLENQYSEKDFKYWIVDFFRNDDNAKVRIFEDFKTLTSAASDMGNIEKAKKILIDSIDSFVKFDNQKPYETLEKEYKKVSTSKRRNTI